MAKYMTVIFTNYLNLKIRIAAQLATRIDPDQPNLGGRGLTQGRCHVLHPFAVHNAFIGGRRCAAFGY
jgi:hypothetical protein